MTCEGENAKPKCRTAERSIFVLPCSPPPLLSTLLTSPITLYTLYTTLINTKPAILPRVRAKIDQRSVRRRSYRFRQNNDILARAGRFEFYSISRFTITRATFLSLFGHPLSSSPLCRRRTEGYLGKSPHRDVVPIVYLYRVLRTSGKCKLRISVRHTDADVTGRPSLPHPDYRHPLRRHQADMFRKMRGRR